MENKLYDIAIIGLGPAGAILAQHLNSGLSVIALDKKSDDANGGGFTKPCGGMLAPDAQKSLSRFDMTLPKDILVDPQIFSVKTIDIKNDITRHYQRHYINMDRDKFDRWLIGKIPPNVQLEQHAICTGVERSDSGFIITYTKNGQLNTVTAKRVVGADGANSIMRRSLYPALKIRTYLAIQQWFEDAHASPSYSCMFDPDVTDAYAWGLTKDKYFIFGGAFDVKTGKADFEALKQKMARYGFCFENPVKTEACLIFRSFKPFNHCYGTNGAFFIGEAAGFISPSSLEGISYAIDSAHILAGCLNKAAGNADVDANKNYRKKTRKIRLKLFLKHAKRPFMYQTFLRKLVLKTGIFSIKMAAGSEEK